MSIRRDTRIHAVPGTRAAHAARTLLAIERESVDADIVAPEGLLKALLQIARGLAKRACKHVIVHRVCELRGRDSRGVRIALHFARSDRSFGDPSVRMKHGIVRVSPAVLPQALRTVVAPLGSIFIALIKNSALAGLIAVVELSETAEQLINIESQPIPIFLGAAVAYLMMTLPSGFAIGWIERKVAIKR